MNNHGKSELEIGAGTNQVGVEVVVPREETIHEVEDLKWVERKPWKYRTKNKVQIPIGDDYAISSRARNNSNDPPPSLITLIVDAENTDGGSQGSPRRVREIVIQEGYAWDGASGPTVDTRASFKASLVHDALYQCMRLGYVTQDSRREVDRLFRHMLGGMGPLRRGLWYWMVRWFGKKAATPKPNKRLKYPGAFMVLLGICWLVHWACSKCWPAQTADLLDCFKGLVGATWMNWLGALLESGLVLLGLLASVYFLFELFGWTFRSSGRKQKGRKHPGIVAYTVMITGIFQLVHWLQPFWPKCCPAKTVDFGEVMALLGARMLVGLGIELLRGDS